MKYRILLARPVRKALDRLPSVAAERILDRISSLADDPRPRGCKKLAGSANDWRIRVGDYRIVYEINSAAREVTILRVRHRSRVYL